MKTKTTKPATPATAPYPIHRVSDAAAQTLLVELCAPDQIERFDATLNAHHYLKAPRPIGDHLRQVVRTPAGDIIALLEWGPAASALKDRDRHIGWSATHRASRLKLVAQNRRFLLLADRHTAPNLASKTLAAALRALGDQWEQTHGYRPLMAETFTDPALYEGTCYKASNWQAIGTTAGYSRHRADYYIPNESPKLLWLYPLHPDAKKLLRAPKLGPAHARGETRAPTGTLPVSQKDMLSLHDLLGQVKDPRAKNARYRIRAVLTITAMALLAGHRDIAQVQRFGQSLHHKQRQAIGLPLKKNTRRHWEAPGYLVYYHLLRSIDNDALATLLTDWLRARAGTLPEALAMDGKMIRDAIGVLTLSSHDDGAPHSAAIYDQKEGTPRCELKTAQTLLANTPTLEGKTITADALHCQRETAALILAKGGDYLLQIKGNQPTLLAQARAPFERPREHQHHPPPFFRTQAKATDASKNATQASPRPTQPRSASPARAAWSK